MIKIWEKQQGFSLVEAVICLALMGILLTLGVGGRSYFERYTYRQFVSETVQLIQKAQQQASRENNIYEISHLERNTHSLIRKRRIDESGTQQAFGWEDMTIPQGIEVWISTEDHKIRFSKDMSPLKAGTVKISNKGIGEETVMTIQVATGEIIIE